VLLRVGTQATEEAVLNPDGSRVTKAVGVVGSLQSCVIEESKAISRGTILDKIIDGQDFLVHLLADNLREFAAENRGGNVVVITLNVGNNNDVTETSPQPPSATPLIHIS
jgi:hypothetical protein